MTGFQPPIFGVVRDCSTNCATTTAQNYRQIYTTNFKRSLSIVAVGKYVQSHGRPQKIHQNLAVIFDFCGIQVKGKNSFAVFRPSNSFECIEPFLFEDLMSRIESLTLMMICKTSFRMLNNTDELKTVLRLTAKSGSIFLVAVNLWKISF